MSRPLALPIRLFSQTARQNASTQCLLQRSGYVPLNRNTRQQQQPTTRSFATSQTRQRAVMPKMRQPAQPSIQRTQKEQQAAMIRSGQLPDDVGLLEDTFVLPRNPTERWIWRLRKKWLKVRFVDFYGMVAFKLFLIKPRPKLGLSEIPPKAAELHERMYTAFAEGKLDGMKNEVCTGLLGSLRARVLQRAPNSFLRWSIKKQLSPPALCSYKAAVLPGPSGETSADRNAQIQAVVKLHTLQSLQHVKRVSKRESKNGKQVLVSEEQEGAVEEKESIEYVVVQRSVRKGKFGDWQVWGFTDETSLAQIDLDASKK